MLSSVLDGQTSHQILHGKQKAALGLWKVCVLKARSTIPPDLQQLVGKDVLLGEQRKVVHTELPFVGLAAGVKLAKPSDLGGGFLQEDRLGLAQRSDLLRDVIDHPPQRLLARRGHRAGYYPARQVASELQPANRARGRQARSGRA